MLLGYDKDGEIGFIFTDEKYLDLVYPNNTAKISDFWKTDHGLTEMFIPLAAWPDFMNKRNYKIVNGRLTLKSKEEIDSLEAVIQKQGLFIQPKSLSNSTLKTLRAV